MYRYEYTVSDTGRTYFEVIDSDSEFPTFPMAECDKEDDAKLIVAALDYLQENSTRY